MSNNIDSKALVSSKAKIGNNVTIGPYAVIGDNVSIGDGSRIDGFAHVLGYTDLGENCHIFPYAVIGNIPQDLKYKGDKTFLEIGANNIIREFTTINPGTLEGTRTVIGSGNLFMAYTHVGHDCVVGSDNVFANNATLAGHVTVEDRAVIGGLSAIHQFCKVGKNSIIGGCSKVVRDVLPFAMADGNPAKAHGLNLIGLRRAKFSNERIASLKEAFTVLFLTEHSLDEALTILSDKFADNSDIKYLLDFVASSKRGIGR